VDDFDGAAVDALANDLGVEASDGGVAVVGLESGGDGGGAVDPETSAAVGPQQCLAQAFDEEPVGLGLGMGIFEDGGAVVKDGAVGLFEGNEDGDLGLSSKGSASEGGWPESGIENGGQFWGWQQ
jgi:hypothetical protein